MNSENHNPVLLNEVLEVLEPKNQGIYIDGTFGRGGYSSAILNLGVSNLYSFDIDPTVSKFADEITKIHGDKFKFILSNYDSIDKHIDNNLKLDGIVLDLGVSSMQLDNGDRGFSFSKNAKLDMRMSNTGYSAYDFINSKKEEEIADIIYKYGQEHLSRKIAKGVVNYRKIKNIETTFELRDIIKAVKPRGKSKIDPATKTFQAIRIYVNKELESLEKFLNISDSLLKSSGKLIIVTFHSLEDKIVKDFFKNNHKKRLSTSKYKKNMYTTGKFVEISKKVITPSKKELVINPRARSAKLRYAIKE